jgi:hypothetical protein
MLDLRLTLAAGCPKNRGRARARSDARDLRFGGATTAPTWSPAAQGSELFDCHQDAFAGATKMMFCVNTHG